MDGIDWTPLLVGAVIGGILAYMRVRSAPTGNTPGAMRSY